MPVKTMKAMISVLCLDRSSTGIMLISAGSLTFEVGLTRLFAIQQFHHFAFVVVSLAVMGFAASGLVLSLRRRPASLPLLAIAFTLASAFSYLTINFLPFDSYSIAWDFRQVWILLLYFSVAGAPFFFSGWSVGACMASAGADAHRPYAANLVGSALGVPLALIVISSFGEESTITLAIFLGLLAAISFSAHRVTWLFLTAVSLLVLFGLITPQILALRLSPYKPLSIARLAPAARITLSNSSASARVNVVESSSIHVLPGLSLNAPIIPPRQAGLFVDGDGPTPINALSPESTQAEDIAAYMPPSLAYELRQDANVLVLTPGAGLDLVIALSSKARSVTTAFGEPAIREILTNEYADFSERLLFHPKLSVYSGTSRKILRKTDEAFDVICFALSQGFRPVTSGAFSLSENFDLTTESFRDAYRRLSENGLLVITRWLGTPPSESARAWSTLLEAFRDENAADLSGRLIAYRGMRTATIIGARRPYTRAELEAARSFLERNGFDPIYLPDLQSEELNRHNRLPEDVYHEIYLAILETPEAAIGSYDFDLRPPTDDRPFFYHFFRWRQTPEVLGSLGLTWQPFGGSGYLVLLALLALMLVLAVPMIVMPAWIARRKRQRNTLPANRAMLYFACLGAGYMLVEIPLIQRLALPLERPVFALAITLFTLLLASGLGSFISPRVPLRYSLLSLVGVLIATNVVLPGIIPVSLAWPLGARMILLAATLIPCGLLMGIPFASGLRILHESSPGATPWAWAVNGAVSGLSGVAAAMIALDAGFSITFYIGALAYFGAWLSIPGLRKHAG
jgi:spermidine synthase